jgi:hypothetical protein
MTDEIKPLRDGPRKVKFSWKVAIGIFMVFFAFGATLGHALAFVVIAEGMYLILMGMSEVFE